MPSLLIMHYTVDYHFVLLTFVKHCNRSHNRPFYKRAQFALTNSGCSPKPLDLTCYTCTKVFPKCMGKKRGKWPATMKTGRARENLQLHVRHVQEMSGWCDRISFVPTGDCRFLSTPRRGTGAILTASSSIHPNIQLVMAKKSRNIVDLVRGEV